jgi:uncharacterized protein YneF (UPF0154 family)
MIRVLVLLVGAGLLVGLVAGAFIVDLFNELEGLL